MTHEELMKQSGAALVAWLDAPEGKKPKVEAATIFGKCRQTWEAVELPAWNLLEYSYRLAPKPEPKKLVRKPLAPGVLKAGMRLRHESWERFHEAIITKIRGNGDIEYSDTPIWVELSDLADGWHYAPTVNDDFRPCWTEVEE